MLSEIQPDDNSLATVEKIQLQHLLKSRLVTLNFIIGSGDHISRNTRLNTGNSNQSLINERELIITTLEKINK